MPSYLSILVTCSTLLLGCVNHEGRSELTTSRRQFVSERPAGCELVKAQENLARRLSEAGTFAVLCLAPGRYLGPVSLAQGVTLWGPRDAVIQTRTAGTVVEVLGEGAKVLGLTVDGRGGRYEMQDAAIAVRADDVTVRGVRIVNAVFGVLTDRVRRATVVDNEVSGQREVALGMRGDGIRLWETHDSLIARNHLADGRDLVVWYSSHNVFDSNIAERGRYGTHFMRADDNVVRNGRFQENVVGVFVMYSHRITIEDSDIVDGSAAGGMGIGIKDSGDVTARRNRFVHNTTGIYIDNSPSTVTEHNLFEHNLFQINETAVMFHGNTERNLLHGNDFAANRDQVSVQGGGDARAAVFLGNRFDDYAGYDLDDDGRGDVPYEIRSLSSELASSYPGLRFFRGTAAASIVEALGRIVPLFAPQSLIVDEQPSLSDPLRRVFHAN